MAWSSDPREWALAELDYLHHLVSRALGKGLAAFRFQFGVQRPQVPGECGALALADLRSHLLGEPFAGKVDVPGVRASLLPMSFRGPALLRPPLFLAGALPMLEQGLAGILKAKRVWFQKSAILGPRQASSDFLRQPCSRLLSGNPSKELKQLASNSTHCSKDMCDFSRSQSLGTWHMRQTASLSTCKEVVLPAHTHGWSL